MIKEIIAATTAASSKLEYMTNDRIDAMVGSHGGLSIAQIAMMDVCVDEVLRGTDISLSFKNAPRIELDNVIERMIACADDLNVDRANAAAITAIILYFAGTDTRAGVPVGNRKLGAMCRIAAKVPRGGVASLPSPKLGNKVSGFPGVLALYQLLEKEGLTNICGLDIPFGAIGTLYMHSVLGEDIVLPEIILKGTPVAVNAMHNSMKGMGMMMCEGNADKITAAILGSAALLEMIHPDANVKFEDGYHPSNHVVGKIAAKTVKLPEMLHLKITGEPFDTGVLIGDLALIMKDSGNISVVGMLAIADIFAMFEEWLVWTGGPTITPMASLSGDPWITMKLLIQENGNVAKTAAIISRYREVWFDPEISKINMNIVAHRTLHYNRGLVSETLALATDPDRVWGLQRRAEISYQMLQKGKKVKDVVLHFENCRKAHVEAAGSKFCSQYFNRDIHVELLKAEPLGRISRKGEGIGKYWAIDPNVDMKVEIDGKPYILEKLCEVCIPKVALKDYEDPDYRTAVEAACITLQDLSYSSICIFNISIPSCVAAAMGLGDTKKIVDEALSAAYLTGAIPGSKLKTLNAAKMAKHLCDVYPKDLFPDWRSMDLLEAFSTETSPLNDQEISMVKVNMA